MGTIQREIVHGVVGKIGEMKGRLKVAVSVDGDRRIFGDMEVVLAGVVVEGGGRVDGVLGERGGECSSHPHTNNINYFIVVLIRTKSTKKKKRKEKRINCA